MKLIAKWLASPILMAFLLVFLAFSAGLATFIENDYGSQAARSLVYNAWWFELVFVFLTLNLLLAIFHHKLYKLRKLPVFAFHLAFIIITIGAAITRYSSVEGTMHIREGETSSTFTQADRWLTIQSNGNVFSSSRANFSLISSENFKRRIVANGLEAEIVFLRFIPHATQRIVEDVKGRPMISLMLLDSLGGRPLAFSEGAKVGLGPLLAGFNASDSSDINFFATDSGLFAVSMFGVEQNEMGSNASSVLAPKMPFQLKRQVVYAINGVRFAFSGYSPNARRVWAYNPDPNSQGRDVLLFSISVNGRSEELFVPLLDDTKTIVPFEVNGIAIGFNYSNPVVKLPFGIRLNSFVLERYPGSQSPSSFTSNVTLIDSEEGKEIPFSIFMNNILNYKGYRFYQSSYDPDEKGTFLSVNSDAVGTSVTYIGYFIMMLGMLLALILPGSRFRQLMRRKAVMVTLLLLMVVPSLASAQLNETKIPVPSRAHAKQFGKLLVQDKGGRMKPLSTLAGETLRKLNRSNSFNGLLPEQVFLGMSAFPDYWQDVPIIRIRNEELKRLLNINGERAAFINFFDYERGGAYRLNALVQEAFAAPPGSRTAMQKELIKADERLNILYQIFSGQMPQLFPLQGHDENRWISMSEASMLSDSIQNAATAGLYARYLTEVRIAHRTGSWVEAKKRLTEVHRYQIAFGGNIVPTKWKVRAEIFLNRTLIYERLIPLYGLFGLLLLLLVFWEFYRKPVKWINWIGAIVLGILVIGFLFHTLGIGLRWYVAGRAPLSNGFETMIYIAWTTMLAGLLFHRRNKVVLPATALLATVTLFVAHLSWMDPEITNLVPVLKSYWLTIHVAVVTASYGFLGMGAILALFNLALMAMAKPNSKEIILAQVTDTSKIVEIVIIVGLYLLTIGSFLGAIWANESWGRYWGWDPKETWAFITILVYTFITHMRQIPALNSVFIFNFASAIGISSVLMTYFGVNYYMSGLHSYAGGEALPFPRWIFLAAIGFLALSLMAWYKFRKANNEKV
jgi:cytochrome c-type biogenesis protein CcsB